MNSAHFLVYLLTFKYDAFLFMSPASKSPTIPIKIGHWILYYLFMVCLRMSERSAVTLNVTNNEKCVAPKFHSKSDFKIYY